MTQVCKKKKIKDAHRVELLLKFLVGVVDSELLKTVHLKRLKPADIQRKMIIMFFYWAEQEYILQGPDRKDLETKNQVQT